MARKFPLMPPSQHDGYIRSNTPMQRYDVSCTCGWSGWADSEAECQDAFKAHLLAENEGDSHGSR